LLHKITWFCTLSF